MTIIFILRVRSGRYLYQYLRKLFENGSRTFISKLKFVIDVCSCILPRCSIRSKINLGLSKRKKKIDKQNILMF